MAQLAVLWDMDGVLVDTAEPHYISWRDTLAEIGIEYSREDFRATFGMNNAGGMKHLYGDRLSPELVRELGEKKEVLFRELARQETTPMPGVLDWLNQLRAWGVKQAVASSAPWTNINLHIDGMGIREYFAAIISGAGMPPKPNPDVFLKAAQAVNVPPQHCMVIEDSIAGVCGAKAAGMRCLAVTTTNPPEDLQSADMILTDLTELNKETFNALMAY